MLNTKLIRPKNDIITRRSFKNYDQDAFLPEHSLRASSPIWASEVSLARTRERGYLSIVPFSVAYTFDDPDDVYWCWQKLYNRVFDDHAPVIAIYFYMSSDSFVLFGGNILHNKCLFGNIKHKATITEIKLSSVFSFVPHSRISLLAVLRRLSTRAPKKSVAEKNKLQMMFFIF